MNNDIVYVTGHKNPDSDSICSSISYAELLKRTGQNAIACRQGPLNEETKFILKYFGLENPLLMTDARATLKEIDLDAPATILKSDTVHHAWHVMLNTQNRSLYVVDDDNHLCGICTTSDLSRVRIHPQTDSVQLMKTASLNNIARTIGGHITLEPKKFTFNGQVHVMTLTRLNLTPDVFKDAIVILSDDEVRQEQLIELGVKCLVLTCSIHASHHIKDLAIQHDCAIIETYESTMHTAQVINESYSVEQIMTKNLITFSENEYVEDVAVKMRNSRVRSYPVLSEEGCIIGGISRYHTRNYRRKKIALVDHSARNQSINHIDLAQLVSIVDHHHIGDISTDYPIEYRNHRCGCTCTIVAGLYKEKRIQPTKEVAGLLMSAILSDTLYFKSATTTQEDIDTVGWLSKIAEIEDVEKYARQMLGASVALKDSTPQEILNRDLKTYEIGRYHFAIGQTNYSHVEEVQKVIPKMKEYMIKEQEKQNLDLLVMLFTDVMGNGSYFVFFGPESYVLHDLLATKIDEHTGFDPNIISRKQQLMPRLSHILKHI